MVTISEKERVSEQLYKNFGVWGHLLPPLRTPGRLERAKRNFCPELHIIVRIYGFEWLFKGRGNKEESSSGAKHAFSAPRHNIAINN